MSQGTPSMSEARDALDRLESALPEAHMGGDPTQQAWVLDKREALATVRAALAAVEQLREHAQHKRDCKLLKPPHLGRYLYGGECSCGLDALLAGSPADMKEDA